MPSVSVRQLYQDNQHKLHLSWAAGTAGSDNRISIDADRPVLALVGHLNFIHHNQVQVLGIAEVAYLQKLEQATLTRLNELFDFPMTLVIVANNLPVPQSLRDYCHTHNVPLLTSELESPFLMDVLRIYLQRVLAVSTIKHGVFLDVFEIGVLLMGQSGLGKSELALDLISRGHSLVADDAVELWRTAPEILEGRCPPMLRDFLEVRGLSIRAETENILNVKIRSVTLPVAAGRNLAVLVEAAVRHYVLQLRGKDSTKEFLERHQAMINKNNEEYDEDYFD